MGLADIEYATAVWLDWYNPRPIHGSLGMISPVECEEAPYAARQAVDSAT